MVFNKDPTKRFTDEEIEALALSTDINGAVLAFDIFQLRDDSPYPKQPLVMYGSIPTKIDYLVCAAPYLYQELGRQFQIMQSMIDLLETITDRVDKAGGGELSTLLKGFGKTLNNMQEHILLARRVATDGPVKVNEDIRKES